MRNALFEAMTWELDSFLSNSWIKPAAIQRDYQWTKEQIDELLLDFAKHIGSYNEKIAKGETGPIEPYFIGTFIIHGAGETFKVFDGLQRLTTLTILLCFLRDRVEDPKLRQRLHDCVADRNGRFRLVLDGNQLLAQSIQPDGATLRGIGGFAAGQRASLKRAAETIGEVLDNQAVVILERLGWFVLRSVHVLILRVKSEEVAEDIFRTVNMRGMRMDDVDLIKGRLAEFSEDEDEINRLLSMWQTVRQDVRHDLRGFVLALDRMERAQPQGADAVEQFVGWMKAEHAKGDGALEGWLKRCVKRAISWNKLNQEAMGGESGQYAQLFPVRAFDWEDWKPLAMTIMERSLDMGRDGAAWRRRMFDQVQRACAGMEIAGYKPEVRQMAFAKAIEALKTPTPPQILYAIRMRPAHWKLIYDQLLGSFSDYKLRRAVIIWLEYNLAKDGYDHLYGATVEHVMPSSPRLDNAWLQDFPDREERLDLVHKLGNLAIIPGALNEAMGDSSFAQKQAAMKSYIGDLTPYRLLESVQKAETWTPDSIRARTQGVADLIWRDLEMDAPTWREMGELDAKSIATLAAEVEAASAEDAGSSRAN